MKYFGMDLDGVFLIQEVDILPTWNPSDEGRLIYDSSSDQAFYGRSNGWAPWGTDYTSRIGSTGPASCRNKFHNPLFKVAQKGLQITVTDGGAWCRDRWWSGVSGGASLSVASSTMTINGKPRPAMKVTNLAAITSFPATGFGCPLQQGLEGRDLVDMLGDNATIRFYFRASVAGKYAAALRVRNSAGLDIKSFLKTFTLAANTITEVLFTVPTDAANWICENTATAGAHLAIGALAGANYQTTTTDAWITGNYLTTADATNWLATAGATVELCLPQLERGTVASEFDCLPNWLEEERCYYYLPSLSSPTSANATILCGGYSISANTFVVLVPFGPRGRGKPTGAIIAGSFGVNVGGTSSAVSGLTFNVATSEHCGVLLATTSAAVPANQPGSLYFAAGSYSQILFTGLEI